MLCKLTVDDTSKMQFGSARANGDEGAALSRATETALRRCAAMFADASALETRGERPTATHPSAGRANGGAGKDSDGTRAKKRAAASTPSRSI